MLFIQEVSIFYHKDVRYAKYAQMRTSKKFDILHLDSNLNLNGEVLLQQLSYMQGIEGMRLQGEYFKTYNTEIFGLGRKYTKQKYINNIRIIKNDDNSYTINYCDDGYRQFKEYGHNQDFNDHDTPFYRSYIINETAFKIYPNEYGRITYNGRYMYHNCGIWYYGLHNYNIINCDKSKFREKMFFKKNPNYEYSNLKYLR